MPANVQITQRFKLLEQLNKNAKDKTFAKVGILGKKDNNRNDKNTNAQIGAVHEFGSRSNNIPKRSFLNEPLLEKGSELNKTIGETLKKELLKPNGIQETFKIAGIEAEQIIQQAFATGGFGKWEPLLQDTIKQKGSSSILIDTAQLRKSISSTIAKL